MTFKRLWQTLRLYTINTGRKRADYCRKKHIYDAIGDNVMIMSRTIPLFSSLIRIHNNVWIASGVTFITHDVTHYMLNNINNSSEDDYQEMVGCVAIMDNVFIGAGVTILYNTRIGCNVVIGAGSVVTKDVPSNSVVAGVPARVICSFDDYLVRRRKKQYPDNLKPTYQNVDEDLVKILWKNFKKDRNEL